MDHIQQFFNAHFTGNYKEALNKTVTNCILVTETTWNKLTELIDADRKALPTFCEKLGIQENEITKYMNILVNNPVFSVSKTVLKGWQHKFEATCLNFLYILYNLNLSSAFNYAADIFVKNCPSIRRKEITAPSVELIAQSPVKPSVQLKDLKKFDTPAMTVNFQCNTDNCKNCPKIMFEPCGHLKYCVKCSLNIQEKENCPFCEVAIKQYHLVNF